MDTINSQAKNRPNHPTPKPVGLIMRLMEKISPHATIVDPFAGSGATLRAAQQLGRGAIGIEINPEYAAEAANLLEEDAKNL
ncbi:DNA methyltransferase [Corynebacterium matruchotii]